jgi:nicotinamidase-related amidase
MQSIDARESLETLALRPAVVTIDLHRGHLDPTVATLPLAADAAAALVERVVPLLDRLRGLHVPVIHVITSYRNREEILGNPYWRFQADRPGSSRSAVAEHNLEGMPGLELMPGIYKSDDAVVRTKKRYDCLLGTDLEMVLLAGRHDSLFLMGVNTNSCVLATSVSASVRDYAVFVVDEAVDTMLTRELHDAALSVIDASFGWVVNAGTLIEFLHTRSAQTAAA